ncbi:PssD/Cps14F family polysaccharide biosynthesis glycosyltransferase [Lactococcus lactis]|uniref:Glycosyltransferase n=1 Tax=Lactococcus lactis subsp. lactis TaxID=1360 RepID=S6C1G6_LACLL|nr:PssD/Cps14F family polysaccharide biosynthesis glycosyltransferase [Lactococcus lactis]QRZ33785.1 PssD/Cps14F family polysaccharide biosynthesis glycosyltransferase [Lactococcus lactis subsp. lactis]BAN70287.1 glycosyltransferase [Lactococcus lactis subsp. lactis]
MKNKTIVICFASSSGGHFEQLMMLRPLMAKYSKSFIITEKTRYQIKTEVETYHMQQVNRKEFLFIFSLIVNSFYSLYITIKKRPNYIICTGALAMIPMCLIGKLFGAKLIYIESFAKINSPTLTGKLLYRIADQFYVQWETMKKFYPKAIFLGGIY